MVPSLSPGVAVGFILRFSILARSVALSLLSGPDDSSLDESSPLLEVSSSEDSLLDEYHASDKLS